MDQSILKSIHNKKSKQPKSPEFIKQMKKLIDELVKDDAMCLATRIADKQKLVVQS